MGIEEHIGDYGVAIAIVIGAVLIIRTLADAGKYAMGLWREAAKERNGVDDRRNDIEEKQLRALDAIVNNLKTADTERQTIYTLAEGTRRNIEGVVASQAEHAATLKSIKDAIDNVPEATAERVKKDLEQIHSKLEEAVKQLSEAALNIGSASIQLQRLQPAAEDAPAAKLDAGDATHAGDTAPDTDSTPAKAA